MNNIEEIRRKARILSEKSNNNNFLEISSSLKQSILETEIKLDDLSSSLDRSIEEINNIKYITENLDNILDDLNDEFFKKTKLSKKDMRYITLSMILHSLRWSLLPAKKNKLTHKEGSKKISDFRKRVPKNISQILIEKVPYDQIITGSNGSNHRIKTLGHDPILGWIFGTHDIIANTMTTTSSIKSFNTIDASNYSDKINLSESFDKIIKDVTNDNKLLPIALIKQGLHLHSDINTKMGLPIPMINILNPNIGEFLNKYNYDFLHVTKHAGYIYLIDLIIGILHTWSLPEDSNDDEKRLYSIKTKKVIAYGNLGSSILNGLYSSISKDRRRIDFIGYINTLFKIVQSKKFQDKVKKEFIESSIDKLLENNIDI